MTLLDEKIEKAKTICILGHKNPDGDCIGSSLAIYNYILNKYSDKTARVYLSPFSDKFLLLPNADKISNDTNDAIKYDLAIIVDSGSLDRLDEFQMYFKDAKDSILFDHHEDNTFPAQMSIVNPKSIATCEILYQYLDKEFLDKNVAMCLYTGLATDSGIFRYKATTRNTLELAGKLIQYGFDFSDLLDKIVFECTLNQRKAQGIAFSRIKILSKGKVSFSYLLDEDLDQLSLTRNDIDNVVVYLREMTDIQIAAFAYQVGNQTFKFSVRGKNEKYNLSEFAKSHEGGGHILAAGLLYHGNINDIIKKFEEDITEFIEEKDRN